MAKKPVKKTDTVSELPAAPAAVAVKGPVQPALEVRTSLGRIHVKPGYTVAEAIALYADHFKLTPEKLASRLQSGDLSVKDEASDKRYTSAELAYILARDAGTGSEATTGGGDPELADASGGSAGTGVSVEPVAGRDAVGSTETTATEGSQSGQ